MTNAKIKRSLMCLAAAVSLCLTFAAAQAWAAVGESEVVLEQQGENSGTIAVSVKGHTEDVSAFRLSLLAQVENGAVNVAFDVNQALPAPVKEVTYAEAENNGIRINIYVAGGSNLLNGTVKLGDVVFEPKGRAVDNQASVRVSLATNPFEMVGTAYERMGFEGDASPVYIDPMAPSLFTVGAVSPTPSGPPTPPEDDNGGGDNGNGGGGGGAEDETGISVNPAYEGSDPITGGQPDDGTGVQANGTGGSRPVIVADTARTGTYTGSALSDTGDSTGIVVGVLVALAVAAVAVVVFLRVRQSHKKS